MIQITAMAILWRTVKNWFDDVGIFEVALLCAFAMITFLGGLNVVLKKQLAECRLANAEAQAEQVRRAWQPAINSVERYYVTRNEDAPVVERVVERVRNVCVRQAGGVSLPTAPSGAGQASRQAQDDRARESYLADVADDLATCQSELTRLDAIREFHNSVVAH